MAFRTLYGRVGQGLLFVYCWHVAAKIVSQTTIITPTSPVSMTTVAMGIVLCLVIVSVLLIIALSRWRKSRRWCNQQSQPTNGTTTLIMIVVVYTVYVDVNIIFATFYVYLHSMHKNLYRKKTCSKICLNFTGDEALTSPLPCSEPWGDSASQTRRTTTRTIQKCTYSADFLSHE